ncbi:hypothetical protein [Kribbella sindirgiensis]|uniref:Uncharacterized protein n=1 Tax=Kribbella sindirgiensis TaxID=1124744 RepID=A0A4R0ITU4_9ACTN|nr:hypothetical protein [Kribbella sindirgiensis]TCC34936.1 hypothetical protein E0H50_13680 [Kribbella sindirgiensis]
MKPFRVALVGTSGAGKSTTAKLLRDWTGWMVLSGVRSHESVTGPLWDLSLSLEAASALADRCDSADLKLLTSYLKLCMFGPMERFCADAYAPDVVIADQHPLVDAAVELPVSGHRLTFGDMRPFLRMIDAVGRPQIVAWADAQARRLGRALEPRDFVIELARLSSLRLADRLQALQNLLNCELPDLIVHLDVATETARRRAEKRDGAGDRDLMADPEERARYSDLLAHLDPTPVVRIDVGTRSPDAIASLTLQAIRAAKG